MVVYESFASAEAHALALSREHDGAVVAIWQDEDGWFSFTVAPELPDEMSADGTILYDVVQA